MDSSTIQKPSNKRTRVFSIVTYISKKDVQDVLLSHSRSLRSFAYILHDKDDTDPHVHLIMRTYDAWTSVQISKWFDEYKLENNANTFVQPASDLHALYDYITHSDYQSRQEGKHQYSKDEIVDGGLFDLIDNKDAYDETFEIVNAMLQGVSTRTLVRRYGKTLIYHYSQFCAVKEAIESEDMMERARMSDERNKQNKLNSVRPVPLDNVNIDDIFPSNK